MTDIQKQILELENDVKKFTKKADAIRICRMGIVQQKAMVSFCNACRNLWGWEMGILKNAFEIGIRQELTCQTETKTDQGHVRQGQAREGAAENSVDVVQQEKPPVEENSQ